MKNIRLRHFIILSLFLLPASAALAATGKLNDATYTVCFTPHGECTQNIVNTIDHAKKTIDVQAYSFTSAPIVKALIHAQKRGVKVLVLLDRSNVSDRYSVINTLKNNHVPFLIDYKPAIAHNKVMIIDGKTVITGSFNFTKSAQVRNAENSLIITNEQLAKAYTANFEKRKEASKSYSEYCMSSTKCKLSSTAKQVGISIKSTTESGWEKAKGYWDKR